MDAYERVMWELKLELIDLSGRTSATTTPFFWDCECEDNYIHPKTETTCSICGVRHDEQPDARLQEVLRMLIVKAIKS
jgi:hypothetical protein